MQTDSPPIKLTFGQRQVLIWLQKQPAGQAFTPGEIAQGTRLPIEPVCARIAALLKTQPPFLEELPSVTCRVTRESACPVRLPQSKPANAQPALQSATEGDALKSAAPARAASTMTIAGRIYQVVDESPGPVTIQLKDRDGRAREARVMISTVREISNKQRRQAA